MSGAAASAEGPRVLCVGRLYCDLIFTDVPRMPSMGTETFAGGLGLHAGGGAFVTAAWLAAQGVPAGIACVLPGPPFRDIVMPEIRRAGVATDLCDTVCPGADPQVTVAITGRDERAFLTRRSGPAAPDLTAADLRRAGVTHLHVGELATLVECPALLDTARAAGATLSLDCGWDDGLTAAAVAPLLRGVDVFLPNAAEMRALAEGGLPEPAARLTIVKQGADGATARAGADRVHARAQPATVVDTTGAGDAFNAGFLGAWLAGAALPDCLAAGNALGARAVAGRGGFPSMPDDPADAPARPAGARAVARPLAPAAGGRAAGSGGTA